MTVRKKRLIKNLKKNRSRLNMELNRYIKYLGCLTVFLIALMMPLLLNAKKVSFPGNCKLTKIEAVYTDCRFDSFAVKDIKLSEDKWVKKRLNTFLPFFDGIYDPKSDTLLIFSSFYHILPNEKIYVETPNDGILQLIERPSPRNNNKWYYEKSPYVPVKLPPGHVEESDVYMGAVFKWDIDYIYKVLKKNDLMACPDEVSWFYYQFFCYRLVFSNYKLKDCTVVKFYSPYVTEIKLP